MGGGHFEGVVKHKPVLQSGLFSHHRARPMHHSAIIECGEPETTQYKLGISKSRSRWMPGRKRVGTLQCPEAHCYSCATMSETDS